jgi:hypothetical protein
VKLSERLQELARGWFAETAGPLVEAAKALEDEGELLTRQRDELLERRQPLTEDEKPCDDCQTCHCPTTWAKKKLAELATQRDEARAALADKALLLERYAVMRDEAERLRSALRTIQQWDSLNPPASGTDFPWLRKLVDDALGDEPKGGGT